MTEQALKDFILAKKRETDTFILAHTYQSPEILDIADATGDSFALSQAAQKIAARRVLMCGVRFMAETVKILSPEKTVILSHPQAGCPMAEQISPERVRAFREAYPEAAVCAYINTTAALKAQADVCVTSSTAVEIVSRLPQKDILFIPDKNLGAYVQAKLPEKNVILWDGCCPVHNALTPDRLLQAKARFPRAKVAIHPECRPDCVALADFVGSTKAIIDYALSNEEQIIFVTERGVCDTLQRDLPGRKFHQLDADLFTCADMKRTTLQQAADALTGKGGEEILMDEALRLAAKRPIDAMLRYGG